MLSMFSNTSMIFLSKQYLFFYFYFQKLLFTMHFYDKILYIEKNSFYLQLKLNLNLHAIG